MRSLLESSSSVNERPITRAASSEGLCPDLALADEGIVVADLAAAGAQARDDVERGRLAHVVDAGLVGDAEDQDPRTVHGEAVLIQHLGDAVDDVVGQLVHEKAWVEAGQARVTRPQPIRKPPSAVNAAAPVLPAEPATTNR